MDNNTLVLANFDGVDEQLVTVDAYGRNCTLVGGAKLDNGQVKFGKTSLYLSGSLAGARFSSVNYITPRASLNFGTDPFTIEIWTYPVSTGDSYPSILNNNAGSWAAGSCAMAADHSWVAGKFIVSCHSFSVVAPMLTSASNVDYATWQHLAWVRVGNVHTLYVNGTAEDIETYTGSISFANGVNIGQGFYDHYAPGWYTGFRISNVARYLTDFTPITRPFVGVTEELPVIGPGLFIGDEGGAAPAAPDIRTVPLMPRRVP